MGLRDKLFAKREAQPVELPDILQPEDPVNYNSVLDWLVGLSEKDYKIMQDVVGIYRQANKDAARALKVKDEPTTQLHPVPPTDEEIDAGLDSMLEAHPDDLRAAMEVDHPVPNSRKKHQTAKKVDTKS